MLKCSDILYSFEIDGTLINNIPYNSKSCFIRNVKLLSSECIFNPNSYDIRWCVITSRPKIDYLAIRTSCFKNSMIPSCIYTHDNYYKMESNIEKIAVYKSNLFKSILDNKFPIKYIKSNIKKIVNVCNDQNENYHINSVRGEYNYISVNIYDFKRGFFDKIV